MIVGIVGDLHLPFTHPRYLEFIQDSFSDWGVKKVHFAGDIVDLHSLSFWETDPNGMGAEREAQEAVKQLEKWYKAFPESTVSIGNHDERHFRKARSARIPDRYLREYSDIWRTPQWDWKFWHIFEGVLYEHGTGSLGKDAALNRANAKRMSIVMGHVHSFGGVKYSASERDRIFGLNVGCGIDCDETAEHSYAFAYGKNFPSRPTLGCGIVCDGAAAYFEPMGCSTGEPYRRKQNK